MEAAVGAKIISTVEDAVHYPLSQLAHRPEGNAILMCDPTYFEVKDVKNLFMEGNVNRTVSSRAQEQWHALKATFEKMGYPVELISSQRDREDMVFTANQVLLGQSKDGRPFVVLARMVHRSRQREVPYFAEWFRQKGYQILEIGQANSSLHFEGQGDALWHPGRQLLWGGWGHRSDPEAYEEISAMLDLPVVVLKLIHPRFYHLDTALCPLDEKTCLVCPEAFTSEGMSLVRHYFPEAVEVSEKEAANFACNALALGRNVLLQHGSVETCRKLKEKGFNPIEVETGEFMKSGGSVSCLKMMIYE